MKNVKNLINSKNSTNIFFNKVVSNVTTKFDFFFRNHSTVNSYLNHVVITRDVTALNQFTQYILHNSNDDLGEIKHKVDVGFQQVSKSLDFYNDVLPFFKIQTFFDQYPKYKINANAKFFEKKHMLNMRTNTIFELIFKDVFKSNYGLKSIEFNQRTNLSYLDTKLVNQSQPDFVCVKISSSGETFEYFVDLKITSKAFLLKKLYSISPNSYVYCNFYYVGGLNREFVFNTSQKGTLIHLYNNGLRHHMNIDSKIAKDLHNESQEALNSFKSSGKVMDYNRIVFNTPKFLTHDNIIDHYGFEITNIK